MKTLPITQPYLRIPYNMGLPAFTLQVICEGETVERLSVRLCPPEQATHWGTVDVSRYQGRILTLVLAPSESTYIGNKADRVTDTDAALLEAIHEVPMPPETIRRPVVHFTPRSGWMNDPNGLHWRDGLYHLYFQHVPCSMEWEDNCHWGHAVSRDLFHWDELPAPFVYQRTSPSGSGWLERSTGDSCIAFGGSIYRSTDGGNWYEPWQTDTINGDPKVFHHDRSGHYVCVRGVQYPADVLHAPSAEFEDAIYVSEDLRTWRKTQDVRGIHECPDLFPVRVEETGEEKWILTGADNAYWIGEFDGERFTSDSTPARRPDVYESVFGRLKDATDKYNGQYSFGQDFWNGKSYAGQVFNDLPDGRVIRMLWNFTSFQPEADFTQCMAVPQELTLRQTPTGLRLCAMPVREIKGLYGQVKQWSVEENTQVSVPGEAFDVSLTMGTEQTATVDGFVFAVDADSGFLRITHPLGFSRLLPYAPVEGTVRLRGVLDLNLAEWYIGQGEIYFPAAYERGTGPLLCRITGEGRAALQIAVLEQ